MILYTTLVTTVWGLGGFTSLRLKALGSGLRVVQGVRGLGPLLQGLRRLVVSCKAMGWGPGLYILRAFSGRIW